MSKENEAAAAAELAGQLHGEFLKGDGVTLLAGEPFPLCYVCCLHAITRGISWDDVSGDTLADGTKLHAAVTQVCGTAVCWYHVNHVHGSSVLSVTGRDEQEKVQHETAQATVREAGER
jgi:hypothetical protein